MDGVWRIITGSILSGLICSFLLNVLNNKIWGIFKPIQKDLGKLTNKTRRILSFSGFLLTASITVLLSIRLNINYFEAGLILGFFNSIKDLCFKENIVENIMKTSKE